MLFYLIEFAEAKIIAGVTTATSATVEQYNALLQKSESLTEQYQLALQEKIRSQTEKQGVESLLQEKNRQQHELEQLNLRRNNKLRNYHTIGGIAHQFSRKRDAFC